jgi:hypothetical protein
LPPRPGAPSEPSYFLLPLAFFGAFAILGIRDLTQRRHAILRNYPIAAHLRFILENIRPEMRQYFFESDKEGMPFPRDKRRKDGAAWLLRPSFFISLLPLELILQVGSSAGYAMGRSDIRQVALALRVVGGGENAAFLVEPIDARRAVQRLAGFRADELPIVPFLERVALDAELVIDQSPVPGAEAGEHMLSAFAPAAGRRGDELDGPQHDLAEMANDPSLSLAGVQPRMCDRGRHAFIVRHCRRLRSHVRPVARPAR